MRQIVRYINNTIIHLLMSAIDVPVRDGDILVNPYALTEDLLPPSKLLEEHLFAFDCNVFRRLVHEVSLICIVAPGDVFILIGAFLT